MSEEREFTDRAFGDRKRDVQVPIPRPTKTFAIFKKRPDMPCAALSPVPA